MATFLGSMRDVRFYHVVGQTDEYYDTTIFIDRRFDSNDGPLLTYKGHFTYTQDSDGNLTDFDGVVNEIQFENDQGGDPAQYFDIGSVALSVSDLKSADFDKDILLPKLFAGDDVLDGRDLYTGPTTPAEILNGYAGNDVIRGHADDDQLDGGAGNDFLFGGTGSDTMTGGTGNDTFYVDDIHDVVIEHAGEGYDSVSSSVTYSVRNTDVEGLVLTGTAAIGAVGNGLNNKLVGNDGGNKMQGLDGNDALYGGLGKDALYGAAGNDTFAFDTKPGTNNVDAIYDFANVSGDNDRILLDHAVFTELTATGVLSKNLFVANATGTASDADDRVVYETDTGKLFYDADGSGSGKAVQFAVLVGHPALTAADFLVA